MALLRLVMVMVMVRVRVRLRFSVNPNPIPKPNHEPKPNPNHKLPQTARTNRKGIYHKESPSNQSEAKKAVVTLTILQKKGLLAGGPPPGQRVCPLTTSPPVQPPTPLWLRRQMLKFTFACECCSQDHRSP